tara:strand:+ start:327 stop:611 length:285 start_codon:yes stop_codon:yes gene_type:complete
MMRLQKVLKDLIEEIFYTQRDGGCFRTFNVVDNFNREGIVIGLLFIQSEKPQQNTYLELNNRAVRHGGLNQYIFEEIEEVQETTTDMAIFNFLG